MNIAKVSAAVPVIVGLSLFAGGCATKKHVREAIQPVQNQVNQVQKQTADNRTAIGELDRQVASADEKATDAGKRANDAAQAAAGANTAAMTAQQRADAANALGQQNQQGLNQVNQSLQNLDNYKLVTTQQVYFKVGQSTLTKDQQAELDNAVQSFANSHNIVVEVEGFADKTGGKTLNMELSRKRAENVVHYLAVEHNIPLRDIRELGVGSEFPNANNHTRAARKENRRVDVKVYALDLTGQAQANNSGGGTTNNTGATGSSDRVRTGSDLSRSTPAAPMSPSTPVSTTP